MPGTVWRRQPLQERDQGRSVGSAFHDPGGGGGRPPAVVLPLRSQVPRGLRHLRRDDRPRRAPAPGAAP
eukprot:8185323-Pyramimonas_sp.AAC.1